MNNTNNQPRATGEDAHTPTPWYMPTVDDPSVITAFRAFQDGAMHPCGVAVVCKHGTDAEREANAAFIVRAVNNHAALVAALEFFENYCDKANLLSPDVLALVPELEHMAEMARSALASAKL